MMQSKGGDLIHFASAPAALVPHLQNQASGIMEIVRINSTFSSNIASNELNLPVRGYFSDENFFKVFDFEMMHGDPLTALSNPNSIVITESIAKTIDTPSTLLGQIVELDGVGIYEVTGIVKDQKRSHFQFDVLVSINNLPANKRGDESNHEQWTSFSNQYLYLLLDNVSDIKNLEGLLNELAATNYQTDEQAASFHLQSLNDITPGPDLENAIGPDTDTTLFAVFGTICLLILLPACFNYGNLSIARALKRSKEVGLRKALGGSRTQIFTQFITETIAITLISLIGGVVIFLIIAPEFKSMMMADSWLDLNLTWQVITYFLLFSIIVGFLTGLFPALHFARISPIASLKGQSGLKTLRISHIRKTLVTFQFFLAFCFIVSLIVFSRQYRYNLNFDFGFNTDNILNVQLQGIDPLKFKTEFSKLAEVQALSMSSDILGLSYGNTFVSKERGSDSLEVSQLFVDADYIDNMKLTLLAGRNLPAETFQHERHILVNEEFLKRWHIPTPLDALGKVFVIDGKELEIVGVLQNFHFAPLMEPVNALCLRMDPSQFAYANIKIASPDIQATIASMERTWRKLVDTRPFEAHFHDDDMEIAYGFYWALLKIVGYMGVLAVSVSLLGLLGMVVYTTEMRTKEIGIRKAMSANETSITYLLSKDFLKIMLWATVFAIPASVFLFDWLLSGLQYYRVSINFFDILGSFILFFLFGIITITSQTWKAATTNPAKILRHD